MASKPSSMMPYRVTLLCACAAEIHNTSALVATVLFIKNSRKCRRPPRRPQCGKRVRRHGVDRANRIIPIAAFPTVIASTQFAPRVP